MTGAKQTTTPERGAIAAIQAASGRPSVLGAWLVLILALSGPSLTSFQSSVAAPLASSISRHFGSGNMGAMIAQLALTLPAIGVIVGAPLTARWLGRFGYRPVIVASTIGYAVAGALGGEIDNFMLFLGTRFIVGICAGTIYSSLVSLTGTLFAGAALGRAVSYQNGAGAFMGMSLMLLSGAVASRLGWQASFLLCLGVGVFAVLGMVVWMPKTTVRGPAISQPRASLRPLIPLYVAIVGTFAVVFTVLVQGSLLMAANGIEDPSRQSIIIAASTLTYAVMATSYSWVETHLTKSWTFTFALTSMGLGILVMGNIPILWGATLGSFMIGTGSGLCAPYLMRQVIVRAPEGAQDRAIGFFAPANYLGTLCNPLIMQSLRVTVGIHWAFIIVGTVVLTIAWTGTIYIRTSARRRVAAAA